MRQKGKQIAWIRVPRWYRIITWKNPDVRLKDGRTGNGKKILIDGQQRITALRGGSPEAHHPA